MSTYKLLIKKFDRSNEFEMDCNKQNICLFCDTNITYQANQENINLLFMNNGFKIETKSLLDLVKPYISLQNLFLSFNKNQSCFQTKPNLFINLNEFYSLFLTINFNEYFMYEELKFPSNGNLIELNFTAHFDKIWQFKNVEFHIQFNNKYSDLLFQNGQIIFNGIVNGSMNQERQEFQSKYVAQYLTNIPDKENIIIELDSDHLMIELY
ncbi:hypothetical protein pb186bvf_013241 [Paramecium bursaria]